MSKRSVTGLALALVVSIAVYGIATGAEDASLSGPSEAPTSVTILTAFTAYEAPTFPARA